MEQPQDKECIFKCHTITEWRLSKRRHAYTVSEQYMTFLIHDLPQVINNKSNTNCATCGAETADYPGAPNLIPGF